MDAGEQGRDFATAGEFADTQDFAFAAGRIAAFFDIDGTLVAGPSLERRLCWALLRTGKLPAASLLRWGAQAAWLLMTRGVERALYSNKLFLAGVPVGCAVTARAKSPAKLLPAAMNRVVWHARQGHCIVLVSGTLEFLAAEVAEKIESVLLARGLSADVWCCATQLERRGERWTGRIAGATVRGAEKARAMRRFAREQAIDLAASYAYGNTANDRWMLETVGKAAAVNADFALARIAKRNDWATLTWSAGRTDATHGSAVRRSPIWARTAAARASATATRAASSGPATNIPRSKR